MCLYSPPTRPGPHEPDTGTQRVISLTACERMLTFTTPPRTPTSSLPRCGRPMCDHRVRVCRNGPEHPHEPDMGAQCVIILCACAGMAPNTPMNQTWAPKCDHPVRVCGNVGLLLPPLNALRDQSRYVRVTIGCTCESALPSRLTPFQPSFS